MNSLDTGTRWRASSAASVVAVEVRGRDLPGEGGRDQRGGAAWPRAALVSATPDRAPPRSIPSSAVSSCRNAIRSRMCRRRLLPGPLALEQPLVADRLAGVGAQPHLGDHDRVALDHLPGVWVGDVGPDSDRSRLAEARRPRAGPPATPPPRREPVRSRTQRSSSISAQPAAGQQHGRSRSRSRARSTSVAPGPRRRRGSLSCDPSRAASCSSSCTSRRGERLAPARELEPRHVLHRQPPPRPRVLEGSHLDLELAPQRGPRRAPSPAYGADRACGRGCPRRRDRASPARTPRRRGRRDRARRRARRARLQVTPGAFRASVASSTRIRPSEVRRPHPPNGDVGRRSRTGCHDPRPFADRNCLATAEGGPAFPTDTALFICWIAGDPSAAWRPC